MEQIKNIQPEQEAHLDKKKHEGDEANYKTKEADSPELNTKDEDLKPTSKIPENIHTKPAEEQQFENEE